MRIGQIILKHYLNVDFKAKLQIGLLLSTVHLDTEDRNTNSNECKI